jgi:biofilm PGA synthesis N-glycosyltransferase PgaC
MEMFIVYFILVTGLINLVHFCAYITGANIYDIQQIRKDSVRKQTRRRRHTPLVSVLVPAHNEELTIIRTLDSIRTNTQRKIEIIVIDDASTDNTYRLVKGYIAEHPSRSIRIIRKRKNAGKGEALNTALRRYARGELIMTLDADSIIDRHAIKRAVAHFDDPRVVGMAANVRILDDESILGLVQKFEHMIGYRSKKFYSITNSEFIIGGVASTYRRSTISKVGFYDTDTITEDIGLSLKVVSEGQQGPANRLRSRRRGHDRGRRLIL